MLPEGLGRIDWRVHVCDLRLSQENVALKNYSELCIRYSEWFYSLSKIFLIVLLIIPNVLISNGLKLAMDSVPCPITGWHLSKLSLSLTFIDQWTSEAYQK